MTTQVAPKKDREKKRKVTGSNGGNHPLGGTRKPTKTPIGKSNP